MASNSKKKKKVGAPSVTKFTWLTRNGLPINQLVTDLRQVARLVYQGKFDSFIGTRFPQLKIGKGAPTKDLLAEFSTKLRTTMEEGRSVIAMVCLF